jgi:hypothetical protein
MVRFVLALAVAALAAIGTPVSAQDALITKAPSARVIAVPQGPPASLAEQPQPTAAEAPRLAPVPAPLAQREVPPPVAAPTPRPEPQSLAQRTYEARFSFRRVRDGFVRLDSKTGHVSFCGPAAGIWTCAAADERSALENEISRLRAENAALKAELLAHRSGAPDAGQAPVPPTAQVAEPKPPSETLPKSAPEAQAKPNVQTNTQMPTKAEPQPRPEIQLPSDVELNRVFAFMEKVWRRMVEMMAALQRDIQRKS